jgi:hypothetical protein
MPIAIVAPARQRYLGATKADLVMRLLVAEHALVDIENRWLQTAGDLLVWIMLVHRLITTTEQTDPAAKKHRSLAF